MSNKSDVVEAEVGANTSEINQSYNAASTAAMEPVELGELMKAAEVAAYLDIPSSKVTLLFRKGVIRRYNAKYWGGYLRSDVEKLKRGWDRHQSNTVLKRKFESEMARENLTKSLKNLAPSEYTEMYLAARGDQSRHVRKLFIKLPGEAGRPKKNDSLYQYLHLSDTDQLDFKTALLMRDATRKNSPGHCRFEVNRVTLPPVKNWSDPRHQNVVKMLVDAASELYGVDFDVMGKSDYHLIAMSQASTTLMQYMNGRTISNRAEFEDTIDAAIVSGEHIPLVTRIDYWYHCLHELVEHGRFFLDFRPYTKRVILGLMSPADHDNVRVQADMKDAIDKAVGAYWWELYDSKWLPVYVGELPYIEPRFHRNAFELNPKDKQLHPEFDPSDSPEVVWLRNRNAVMMTADAPDDVLIDLQKGLMRFHRLVIALITKLNNNDQGVSTAVVKSLTRQGVDPKQIYLTPFEAPRDLLQKMDKIHAAFENAAQSLGVDIDAEEENEVQRKAEEMSADSHETPPSYNSAVSPDGEETVQTADREVNVRRFYEEYGKPIPDNLDDKELVAVLEPDEVDALNRMVLASWGYDV